jgi:hypothetical protein
LYGVKEQLHINVEDEERLEGMKHWHGEER